MANKTELAEGVICKGSLQFGSGCGSCSRCKDEIRSVFTKLEAAETEIAALRGAAVPVAWRHETNIVCNRILTQHEAVADEWLSKGFVVTPLFTHPAPPVVVLPTNEPFWTAVNDILEQSEMKGHSFMLGNVQIGRSAAKDLSAFFIEILGLKTVKSADGEGE